MAKSILRIKARKLRRDGLGIKTIAHSLGVSSGTVSLWCRDIELSPEQIAELERRSRDPYYGKRLGYVREQQKRKQEKIVRFFNEGKKQVGVMSKRDVFVTGVGLYWAEGFKKDNLVGFSNSDPAMVNFFIYWLMRCCGIAQENIKLRVGVNQQYKDRVEEIQGYWAATLRMPRLQFQKPYFQRVAWKKIYENADEYHGVMRVRVAKSTDLLRRIHGWIEGIKISRRR